MEHVGVISEGEWNSLNGMCSDEAEFMAQLLGNCSLPNEVQGCPNFPISSSFWPSHHEGISVINDESANVYSFSQESGGSGYSGGILFPYSSTDYTHQVFMANGNFTANSNFTTMDYCMNGNSRIHVLTESGDDFLNQDVSNDSMESNEDMSEDVIVAMQPMSEFPKEGKISPSESKKRSRIPPGEVRRNNKAMKLKKSPKADDNDEDNFNNSNNNVKGLHRQSSSGCCSEDDSNGSQEMNGVISSTSSKGNIGTLNSSGKTRASRGSATDPQSLYARKRRERINERLRILQNLVPNGTKVDISTMLEEAVQYVKFLQLQIKLLSSDDLWMYAPLAYNGMDIGLDLKIATPKPQS